VHRGVLACKPSAPVPSNPSMKGLNVFKPTTKWPWPRHGAEPRRPTAPVICGECGTTHQALGCPECGNPPDRLMVGVLRAEVTTHTGRRLLVRAERDPDSCGWVPTDYENLDTDTDTGGEGSGTMWAPGTVWGSRP
jgi:hypothetical protein